MSLVRPARHACSRAPVVVALAVALAPAPAPAAPPAVAAWYRVSDYASIQAAVDSCVAHGGGVVYFPPGVYVLPRAGTTLRIPPETSVRGPLDLRHGVTLQGDGPDVSEIRGPAGVSNTLLRVMRDGTSVQGLTFTAGPDDSTSAADILIGDDTDPGHVLKYVRFRDVNVRGAGVHCVATTEAPAIAIETTFESCRFLGNRAPGGSLVHVGRGSTTFHFNQCEFGAFRHTAATVSGAAGITFRDCVFEGELDDDGPFVSFTRAINCSIESGWFEDDVDERGVGQSRHQWFVRLDKRCHGFLLSNGTFTRGGDPAKNPRQPRVLQVLGSTPGDECVGVVVLNPDISVNGVVDTSLRYVQVESDRSKVQVVGGVLRDAQAYRRVLVGRSSRTTDSH